MPRAMILHVPPSSSMTMELASPLATTTMLLALLCTKAQLIILFQLGIFSSDSPQLVQVGESGGAAPPPAPCSSCSCQTPPAGVVVAAVGAAAVAVEQRGPVLPGRPSPRRGAGEGAVPVVHGRERKKPLNNRGGIKLFFDLKKRGNFLNLSSLRLAGEGNFFF